MNALPERKRITPLASREDGVVSLEVVILFPVMALIILAVLEFGHLWIVRHTLTIATREGARAAVVFVPGSDADRAAAAQQTAQQTVTAYLQNTAKWDPDTDFTVPEPIVTPGPTGLTGGTLTVRAQTTNALLVLHKMIKDIPVVGETTMRFE